MKRKYEWKNDPSRSSWYYWNISDGRIVGQVTLIGHTEIYVGKIIHNHNQEEYLGQYISLEHTKLAVTQYYDVQDRTLLE